MNNSAIEKTITGGNIMAERRPLATAVNSFAGADPDQVRAFITQEPKRESTTVEFQTSSEREKPATPKKSATTTQRSPKKKPTRLQPVGLIPVTIRLRPEIAGALKRASLERQLNGEETFTQQELVENALEPWLMEEGYISGEV